jgi:hypothetical protein
MILGVHNMVDAVTHYAKDHTSSDGAWWILGLDGLLLVPILFAIFFYPLAVLMGVGAVLLMGGTYYVLLRALHGHRSTPGHR